MKPRASKRSAKKPVVILGHGTAGLLASLLIKAKAPRTPVYVLDARPSASVSEARARTPIVGRTEYLHLLAQAGVLGVLQRRRALHWLRDIVLTAADGERTCLRAPPRVTPDTRWFDRYTLSLKSVAHIIASTPGYIVYLGALEQALADRAVELGVNVFFGAGVELTASGQAFGLRFAATSRVPAALQTELARPSFIAIADGSLAMTQDASRERFLGPVVGTWIVGTVNQHDGLRAERLSFIDDDGVERHTYVVATPSYPDTWLAVPAGGALDEARRLQRFVAIARRVLGDSIGVCRLLTTVAMQPAQLSASVRGNSVVIGDALKRNSFETAAGVLTGAFEAAATARYLTRRHRGSPTARRRLRTELSRATLRTAFAWHSCGPAEVYASFLKQLRAHHGSAKADALLGLERPAVLTPEEIKALLFAQRLL